MAGQHGRGLGGAFQFVAELGYGPGWSFLLRCKPHAHATMSVDVAALGVQLSGEDLTQVVAI